MHCLSAKVEQERWKIQPFKKEARREWFQGRVIGGVVSSRDCLIRSRAARSQTASGNTAWAELVLGSSKPITLGVTVVK